MTETMLSNTGAEKLKSFVERIERLNEDRAAVVADLAEGTLHFTAPPTSGMVA